MHDMYMYDLSQRISDILDILIMTLTCMILIRSEDFRCIIIFALTFCSLLNDASLMDLSLLFPLVKACFRR